MMRRFLSRFALMGAIVPLLFLTIWHLVDQHPSINIILYLTLFRIQLILWPSSMVTFAAPADDSGYFASTIAVLVNVALYIIVGTALWRALKQHYVLLVIVALILTTIWWKLLTSFK